MMGRGIRIAVAPHWRGLRVLLVVIAMVLIWTLGRYTNPWDLLAYATNDHTLLLIVLPLYLLLLYRNVHHPMEALLTTRMGQARTWWMTQVVAAGVTAWLVALTVAALGIVVPLVTHHWSWQWGPNMHLRMGSAILATAVWRIPWHWAMESLSLMAVGFWSLGVFMYVLTLWWRSPWLAWIGVILLNYLTLVIKATPAQFLVWILPGIQFSLALHWMNPQHPIAPAWSFSYALALLVAMTGAGVVLVEASPWDASHGGVL